MKYELLLIMMYQYWLINYDKSTILMQDAIREETECEVYGNFVLAQQFFYNLKLF